jgi:hypothetical protein
MFQLKLAKYAHPLLFLCGVKRAIFSSEGWDKFDRYRTAGRQDKLSTLQMKNPPVVNGRGSGGLTY